MVTRRHIPVLIAALACLTAAVVMLIGADPFVRAAYGVSKSSVPEIGSKVGPGDVVTYRVTVAHQGEDAVPDASFADDLSGVMSDAMWNGDLEVSGGVAAFDGGVLVWGGHLEVGDEVTVTYSVTVAAESGVTLADAEPLLPATHWATPVWAVFAALGLVIITWCFYIASNRTRVRMPASEASLT
jgi:hypothetical protein